MVFFSHIKLSNPSNTKLKSFSEEKKKLCPENILVIVSRAASGKIVLLKLQALHIHRRTSRETDGRTDGQSVIQFMYTSNQPPRDISFYFSLPSSAVTWQYLHFIRNARLKSIYLEVLNDIFS